jgi:hypothetical protein
LPTVETPSAGDLAIEERDDVTFTPSVQRVSATRWRIATGDRLSGAYRLSFVEQIGPAIDPLVDELSVDFVPDALEHNELRSPNPRDWIDSHELAIAGRTSEVSVLPRSPIEGRESIADERAARLFDDLTEALYAGGRSGWSEVEVIETIRALLGPTAPRVWDVLRSYEEAGWMYCASSISWRARRWWLRAPEILFLSAQSPTVILRGMQPRIVRERFEETARSLGGRIVIRNAVGPYGPTMTIAVDVDVDRLSQELRWPVSRQPAVPEERAPECWTSVVGDPGGHSVRWFWNWSSGRFGQERNGGRADVVLTRCERERRDAADLFVVEGRGERFVTPSRAVAICEAYRRARAPMWVLVDGLLVTVPDEGHLVLPIARAISLSGLRHSAPIKAGESWRYAHEANLWAIDRITHVFGASFVRAAGHELDAPPAETFSGSIDAQVLSRRRPKLGRAVRLQAAPGPLLTATRIGRSN